MNRMPRLLPLIAVALGGVISIKAISSIEGVPQALAGARAWAEEAAPKVLKPAAKPAAKPDEHPAEPAHPPETVTSVTDAAPRPIAACAPTAAQLARDAGLSPAELQVLQSLGTRRGQLDEREAEMDTQLQLLAAAEAKLDAKLKALSGLKGEIQSLVGLADQKEKAEIARLVTVYSKMKPREAAAIMVQLSDKVRIPVAAAMKETGLALILAQMPASEAKKLTESLADRYDQAQSQAQALATAANANAAANAPTAKPAAPAPTAAAKPPAAKPAA
jgi:flagellar motility protein MotE (MotC chaperone)